MDLHDGLAMAAAVVDDGKAAATLAAMVQASRGEQHVGQA